MGVALCPLDAQATAIQAKIARIIRQFYPDIQIEARGESIWLSSQSRDAADLQRVYRAVLINERLVKEAYAGRANVMERLIR